MQNGLKTLLNCNQRSRLREANWTQTGKKIILSLELPTLHDTLHIRSCNANINCLRFLHMNLTPYKCSKFRFILSSSIYHSLLLKTQSKQMGKIMCFDFTRQCVEEKPMLNPKMRKPELYFPAVLCWVTLRKISRKQAQSRSNT